MYYLDASLIVTFLTREPGKERVSAWFENYADATLFVSPWVTTEVASALSLKERRGDLTAEMRAEARSAFALLCDRNFESKTILNAHFEAAARYCDQVSLGIRAGDALHLAIAAHYGLTLVTRDKLLAEAGPINGVATLLL